MAAADAAAASAAPATSPGALLPDDASVGSSTDCAEGRAGSRLAAIKEVLDQIFDYYSIPSSTSSRVLTSARFNKMLLDSKVIDERLSNGKADLVFAKVCGHASNPMSCEQFLDAVVQLAREKFPQVTRAQGIEKLYCEHFFSFSAGQEEPLGGLSPEIVEVMAEARSGLQGIYRTYFVDCVSTKEGAKPLANPHSVAQDAWVQFLADYEVLPEFAQKPMVFAAFRESSQLSAVPAHMRQQILGDEKQDVGRFFTYVHFALALMSLARRCFADFCAGSLIRLFQWMDDSKGHILAASRGSVSPATLRILGQFGPSHELAQSLLAGAGEQTSGARTTLPRSSVGSVGMRRSVSLGQLRKSVVGPRESPASSASGAPPVEPKGCTGAASASTVLARAARLSETLGPGVVTDEGASVLGPGAPARAEELVHQLFSYYAALGDTLNQTHLTLLNFSHFLRDCGLVGSEGRSDFFDFVPAERVQQARRSLSGSGTGPRRSGSAGSLLGGAAVGAGTLQHRGSRTRLSQANNGPPAQSALERTPPSKRSSVTAVAAPKDLPLRVYQQPPITQVDADLIFVQAIHNTEGHDVQRALAKRRPSTLTARGSTAEKPSQRHRMTLAAFGLAIQTLSIGVFKGKEEEEEVELREMVEEFCREVLEPLSKILLGSAQQEVLDAADLLNREETALFSKSRPGLDRIFTHYARMTQKQPQQHWTPDDISKFVRDFGLAAELSQRPVQQIFRACVSHERFDLKEMSFGAFQLALVIMAQRIHSSFKHSALDKVVLLLHRMNTASREEAHVGPKPPNSGILIPGLPPLTSLVQQDAKMLSVSVQPASSTPPGKTASMSRASSSTPSGNTPPAKALLNQTASSTPGTRRVAESWAGVLEAEGMFAA